MRETRCGRLPLHRDGAAGPQMPSWSRKRKHELPNYFGGMAPHVDDLPEGPFWPMLFSKFMVMAGANICALSLTPATEPDSRPAVTRDARPLLRQLQRAQGDGLAALVREALGEDPFSGTIFIFRSKRADRLKIVAWDGSGLVLLWKRLEHGAFRRRDATDRSSPRS